MQKLSKVIALMLSIVMIFSILPLHAFALESNDISNVTITIGNDKSDSAKLVSVDGGETDYLATATKEGGKYTINTLKEGSYKIIAYNGEFKTGSIVVNITEDNKDISFSTVNITCGNEGFVYGSDYTIENLKVLSGGSQATVSRESTLEGDNTKSFLVLEGDTFFYDAVPTVLHSSQYATKQVTGTVNGAIQTDSTFTLTKAVKVSITYPYADVNSDGENDFILDVAKMTNYFIYSYFGATETVKNGDTETKEFMIADKDDFMYRVTNNKNSDVVTYGNYAAATADLELTVSSAQLTIGDSNRDKNTVDRSLANPYDVADIYFGSSNNNLYKSYKGFMSLGSGDSISLYPFRNWLAIESISNAKVVEPDFNLEVINIEGKPIEVNKVTDNTSSKGSYKIEAKSTGTAILLVTYDAMTDDVGIGNNTNFSAVWPENTGVIVVTVDKDTGFDTGMLLNDDYADNSKVTNTGRMSKMSGNYIDAELDVLYYEGNDGAEYTFKPANKDTEVSMSVGKITDNKLNFGNFTTEGIVKNDDGTITLTGLTEGKTIVKLVNGDKVEYQVIKTKKVDYKITSNNTVVYDTKTGVDKLDTLCAGDTLKIEYENIYHPANKLSGIYNMAAGLNAKDSTGVMTAGTTNQYLFASTPAVHNVTVTIPKTCESKDYSINLNLLASGYGSEYGLHTILTYELGKTANFTAVQQKAYFGQLPSINIELAAFGKYNVNFKFYDEDNKEIPASDIDSILVKANGENVDVTDATFECEAGTEYSYTIIKDGYRVVNDTFMIKSDDMTTINIGLAKAKDGDWNGVTETEPESIDGVYQISNASELAWFRSYVNSGNNSAKAILLDDIDLLGCAWTPISNNAAYTGTFDGNGKTVSNMNVSAEYAAFIDQVSSGTVKGLSISGKAVGTKYSAGIVARTSGAATITNCQSDVLVSGGTYAAGIVAYSETKPITVSSCANLGEINAPSATSAAGIVAYLNKAATISNCYNWGNITAKTNAGGIIGAPSTATIRPAISNCYNAGKTEGSKPGAISGGTPTPTTNVTNTYYLEGSSATVSNYDKKAIAKTAAELKDNFANTLGSAYKDSCGSYPVLTWQTSVGHKLTYVSNNDATCYIDGTKTGTCATCGYKETVTDKGSAGHTFGEWKDNGDATCTEGGTKTATCSACGATKTEATDALGHDWIIDKAVAATCTSRGLGEGKHCSRCDAKVGQPQYSSFGHDLDENGICKRCGMNDDDEYVILEGENQILTSIKELTVRASGLLKNFVSLEIDGKTLVEDQDYTAKSGSTIVTILSKYLDKLANGKHALKFNFIDGSVSTVFTLDRVSTPNNNGGDKGNNSNNDNNEFGNDVVVPNKERVANTSDSNALYNMFIVSLVSSIGLTITRIFKRKDTEVI